MDSAQDEVKALLDRWSRAIRARDIDRLMALYSPDSVYFHVVPPLQFTGHAALRKNFLRWFDAWASAIGVEIRDVHFLADGDIAVALMLHRTSGTLKNGREVDNWVRVTMCCQRSDQQDWRIAHEHVSLPVDVVSGRVIVNLVP